MNEFFDALFNYEEGHLGVRAILLCLCSSFVLGQFVAWVYAWTHRGLSGSTQVAHALVGLALIVGLVMLVIGNNVARAFGLFGALALIRFRTPVKDTRDTVYLFFAVAIGIAAGTQNHLAAVVGTVGISAVMLYLYATGFGSRRGRDGFLRFELPKEMVSAEGLRAVLRRHCRDFDLVHVREAVGGERLEYGYDVEFTRTRSGSELVSEMQSITGLSGISLLLREEVVEP